MAIVFVIHHGTMPTDGRTYLRVSCWIQVDAGDRQREGHIGFGDSVGLATDAENEQLVRIVDHASLNDRDSAGSGGLILQALNRWTPEFDQCSLKRRHSFALTNDVRPLVAEV
ncbi:MAG: hypothetical protein B9S38_01105 [Verrucomicrobiia bacterium Tous-C4TDCM]|jgi:hypothetical protein|nr:MAG: hypothetical protein B9S38_01105 [Verrucomicrobiae bacterium Tous-C4TDCM]